MDNIKALYEDVCMQYVQLFCKKHELEFDYWTANEVGTIAFMGDYVFNFQDIITDIEKNAPENEIIEWYDYTLRMHDDGKVGCMNYKSWLMGAKGLRKR